MRELVINDQTGWANDPEDYQPEYNGPIIVNNAAMCRLFQEYTPVMNEDDDDVLLPTPSLLAPRHSRRLTRNEEAQAREQHSDEDEEEDEDNVDAYLEYDDEDELDGAQMIPPAINWAANTREQRGPQRKRRGCGCNRQRPVNNRLDDGDLLVPPTMNW